MAHEVLALLQWNTAKTGIINYTRTLALDHSEENIRATAVCPGYINAPLSVIPASVEEINSDWLQRIPMHRAGTAEEVAELIVFLLSPAAIYYRHRDCHRWRTGQQ